MIIYSILYNLYCVFLLVSLFFALALCVSSYFEREKIKQELQCSPLIHNNWMGADVLFLFLFYIVANYTVGIVPDYMLRYMERSPVYDKLDVEVIEYAFYLSSNFLFIHLPGIFICLLLAMKYGKKFIYNVPEMRGFFKNVGYGCLCFTRIILIVMFVSYLSVKFLGMAGYEVEPQEILYVFTKSSSLTMSIYIAFIAIIIGPIFEELIFRGVFFQYTLKYTSVPVAIFAISAIFAAIHVHIPSFAPLFVLSCGFCLAYLKSGSIVAPITMHVLFNAINLLALTIVKNIAP